MEEFMLAESTAVTRNGATGCCMLWNASAVAELDLRAGRVVQMTTLLAPKGECERASLPAARR